MPETNTNRNDYITEQLKSGLKDAINSMLNNIEIIRINFEGNFFSQHNITKDDQKLEYLGLLLNLEKAIYATMLSAHAEGYFEKHPRQEVMDCISTPSNTISAVNNEIDLNIKQLQVDLLSTIGFTLIPFNRLHEELLKSNDQKLNVAIKSFIKKLECMNSQLGVYFADRNARRDEASKLKQMQSSDVGVNSTFFGQQQPPSQISPTQGCTMGM